MGIEFFDKIFVLNLPERTDRLESVLQELREHDIQASVVDSIKGDPGWSGLLKTMKKIFGISLSKGYKNILVLEDDVRFMAPAKPFLENVLPQLPEHYHCFQLGTNLLSIPTRISENILKISSAYSTHAVAYSREGMELILPLLDQEVAYDILLMKNIQVLGHCYCTFPQLAMQRPGHSDIEGKFVDWQAHSAMTFSMMTKKLQPMEQPKIPCSEGHTWEGVRPLIDSSKMEPQFKHFWGQACDCGRMKIVAESECGCYVKVWEIQIIPVQG